MAPKRTRRRPAAATPTASDDEAPPSPIILVCAGLTVYLLMFMERAPSMNDEMFKCENLLSSVPVTES